MLGQFLRRQSPVFLVSLALHAAVLVPMAFMTFAIPHHDLQNALETLFDQERTTDDFTKELGEQTAVSETDNLVSEGAIIVAGGGGGGSGTGGGGGGGGGGGSGGGVSKIDDSGQLQEPDVNVGGGEVGIPGVGLIGKDLGPGKIKGESAAPVADYGGAMDRVTQELVRMMRTEKVLVVWLFDESESMKDDQKKIKEHFRKIYTELGIQQEKDSKLKVKDSEETLLTAVHSYGKSLTKLTAKPTAADREIMSAIDKIAVDETGVENTCTALMAVADQYRPFHVSGKRKVMFVVVTDESGDDGEKIDAVIQKVKAMEGSIYVLGRESVFGYPYARMQWIDPKYNLPHWLTINRGPESAYFEALQYDGMHGRWDAHPSGFAPYEQARMCSETGGIFFILPGEEQNLIGQVEVDKRKFQFLDMKQYVPELIPRAQYVERRGRSKFRETIFLVASRLNPGTDEKLNIQEHWYSADKEKFLKTGQENFTRAINNLQLLDAGIAQLEAVKPLRAKEESLRWRANYDLALAQCKAYRVRLFQFCLVMDKHLVQYPPTSNPKHNVWNLGRTPTVIKPDARQIKLTKVDFAKLTAQEKEAREQFEFIIKEHPGTPWALRAANELSQGFGWIWVSDFRDPRYDNLVGVKVPVL